jgi:small-conductance mechanosensitive channel
MYTFSENHLYLLFASSLGFAVGFITEKLLLKRIIKFFLRQDLLVAHRIVSSLKGLVTTWLLTISSLIAANILNLSDSLNDIINKLCLSILVLTLSIFAGRILVSIIKVKTEHSGSAQQSTSIILNIVRAVILVIGIMLVLQVFGISITPMLTALGVGGLAVALALQDTLSNLFSGIQIVATKRIRNGDYILLDSGQEGYVEDITWRNTVIKNLQNNLIIIPNSKLSNSLITNYSFPEPELSVVVEIGVSYDSDLSYVEEVVKQAARECVAATVGGVNDFEPLVRFHTFADSSVNFRLIVRADNFDNFANMRHELIKTVHKRFKEKGVEIPFPIRTLVVKNGNVITSQ